MFSIYRTQLSNKILDSIMGLLLLLFFLSEPNYFFSKTFNMSLQIMTIWKIRPPNSFQVFREGKNCVVLHVWHNDILSHDIDLFLKKRDTLLVEAEFVFYHFMGIILCNAQRLKFHWNKEQEHRGTVQQVFYSPMLSFFSNLWSCQFCSRHTFFPLTVTSPL